MVRDPETGEVKPDPEVLTGKESISIMTYHSGFVAYLPDIASGLCGKDLRRLAVALNLAADRVDSLNRSYEKEEIDILNAPAEEIFIKTL